MNPREVIDFLHIAEKLKCNTRHSWTSSGRQESIAEHSWRLGLMALLLTNEFPQADMNKVIKMCLCHDLGEAITGDIPSFYKTLANEVTEKEAVSDLLQTLPSPDKEEWKDLFWEMDEQKTQEAKIYKALDKLETIMEHNEADLSTWIPLEYEANLVYGAREVEFSQYLQDFRKEINADSRKKIENVTENGK